MTKTILEKMYDKVTKSISINIWDDYYDDGYVPEGEILETYIYVEEYDDITDEEKKEFLLFLKEEIDKLKLPIQTRMDVYDTKLKYPNLNFEENGLTHWRRDEIRVVDLTHELRYELLKLLKESQLQYNKHKLDIYSES